MEITSLPISPIPFTSVSWYNGYWFASGMLGATIGHLKGENDDDKADSRDDGG